MIDLLDHPYETDLYCQGDIAQESVLQDFAAEVIGKYGHVDFLINNALPLFKGIRDCTYDEFNYALRVGVSAPFIEITARILHPMRLKTG